MYFNQLYWQIIHHTNCSSENSWVWTSATWFGKKQNMLLVPCSSQNNIVHSQLDFLALDNDILSWAYNRSSCHWATSFWDNHNRDTTTHLSCERNLLVAGLSVWCHGGLDLDNWTYSGLHSQQSLCRAGISAPSLLSSEVEDVKTHKDTKVCLGSVLDGLLSR